jgi:chemotaxis signal transduction protein
MLVDSISGIETPLAAANIPQKLEVRGNFFLDRRFEIKGHPEMLSCIDPVKIIELAGAAVTVYGQKKPQPDGRFIIAAISGVYCGFPVETVKEILPCAGSAGVLRTGDFPEGLIRYQKTAVPMVDLIGKLGIAGVQKSPESRKERCLIFRGKDHLTGTRVDCIVGIMTIPGYLIDSPLNLLKHNSPIRGFAHLKDIENVVIVLDPESF